MILRPATVADVPAIVALVRSAYRGEASRVGWTSEAGLVDGERIDEAGARELIDGPAGVVLVAQDGGGIAGCCHVRAQGAGVAHLGTFAVDPRRQAGGVGRRLLDCALGWAGGRLGAATVEIEVLEPQTGLIAWYERRGFRATGETRPFPADPTRARVLVGDLRFVVMRAPVSAAAYALSWSGGKDSAMALQALRAGGAAEPVALVTTINEDAGRVSIHGVRRELLLAQARALGLALVEVLISAGASNDLYQMRLAQALGAPPLDGVDEVVFGDLFLADIRAYRETQLATAGKRAAFPLWGQDTATLARRFLDDGFAATIVCVDPRALDPAFAGRAYDASLLAELPPGVDPCGENGEFHTFVHAGPIFSEPIACRPGEVVTRDGFAFAELQIPAQ